jgi:hypothetical protein
MWKSDAAFLFDSLEHLDNLNLILQEKKRYTHSSSDYQNKVIFEEFGCLGYNAM